MKPIIGTLLLLTSVLFFGGSSHSQEPKEKKEAMYYVLEEKDGAYTVVFFNTPIGKKYDFPIPNLNGIYARATENKKHYISVGAFAGKLVSVSWDKKKVPSKKELEKKK